MVTASHREPPPRNVEVRPLGARDIRAVAALHEQLAAVQFLARGGPSLLVPYYRAWAGAPGAIALAAVDSDDRVVGVLLGSSNPARHHRAMVRRGAPGLALGFAGAALSRPAFRRELLRTRLARYIRGLARLAAPQAHEGAGRTGEITHVVVDASRRGSGVGRLLVEAALGQARVAGCQKVELVTEAGSPAAAFYEHLGWALAGTIVSASGEPFARYRFGLHGATNSATELNTPVAHPPPDIRSGTDCAELPPTVKDG